MMKRIMACLLAIVCLMTALVFAMAEGMTMKVVNVNEAVNLREKPNTDSKKLASVPKGALVTDCEKVKGSEWYSVNYEGIQGYIRGDKLEVVETAPAAEPEPAPAEQPAEQQPAEQQPAAPAEGGAVAEGTPLAPAGAEQAEQQPGILDEAVDDAPIGSINDGSDYEDDDIILEETVKGVRVVVRQIYQETREYMVAVGLDEQGNELWKHETATHNITELQQTAAFMAGIEKKPLLMMYNASKGNGLVAVNAVTGEVEWELPRSKCRLGGSISYVVSDKGVMYIGGYYGPDPVAINRKGKVKWKADSGVEATWLYRMELREDGIACQYGSMAGDNSGTVIYDFDGNVKEVIYD